MRGDAKPEEVRASESDPDAARMKLPNGGFALAYNVQTVTDTQHGLIVTVTATNQGSDNGLLKPLLEQVEQEQGRCPAAVLVDSGYSDAGNDGAQVLETRGVMVYMPPRDERVDQKAGRDPYSAEAAGHTRAEDVAGPDGDGSGAAGVPPAGAGGGGGACASGQPGLAALPPAWRHRANVVSALAGVGQQLEACSAVRWRRRRPRG